MSWWQCLHLKSLKGRTDFCRQDFTSTFFFSARSSITYLKLSMLSPNSPEHEPVHWRVSDQKLQNYHAVFCKTDSLILFARFASEEVNSVSLHLNLHLFWSAFFRVNFLSLFVAVSFPPSPSLPLPLPPSLPPSQSWQSILSLLLYHSHFGRLPKGRGKEKKKNVLSPDRKLILVICIKNIKRHRHEKRIWGDTLIKHSG